MAKKTKGKMNYGKVSLSKEDLDINNYKVRITTFIDYPVYEELKKRAKEGSQKYQTLLNQILKDAVLGKEDPISDRVKETINEMIDSRLGSLGVRSMISKKNVYAAKKMSGSAGKVFATKKKASRKRKVA